MVLKFMKHLFPRKLRLRSELIHRVLALLLPFGRKELGFVLILVIIQGVVQALGVFSIMPFLALVTNPEKALASEFAQKLAARSPLLSPENIVLTAGVATVTLLVLSGIVNGLTDYYRSRYAYFSGMRIGSYLLHAYANQPYVFHLKHNSAELIKRLQSEVNIFMSGVLIPLLDIVSRSVNVLLILTLLLLVNPLVCVVMLTTFSLLLCISFIAFRQSVVRGNIERKYLISQRFLSASQLLTGIKTAMIHRRQDYFIGKFKQSSQRIAAHDAFVSLASSTPQYVIESLAFSSIVILVLVIQMRDQPLQDVLPPLVFFVVAAYRMLPALQTIYSQITKIQSQQFAIDTLYEDYQLLHHYPVPSKQLSKLVCQKPLPFDSAIVFDNVTYRYPDVTQASLQNVSFTIKKGQKIGIVGASGAGKSTLVDLMIGLLKPYSGSIKIDSTALNEANIPAWQNLVGYVSQDIFLLDDTLRNNIAFGIASDQVNESKVIAAAKIAQIHDYIVQDMSEGYDTVCGERGVRLSGGQRQRIALARALYHQPSVLIFDEATSALDNETERNLVAAINALPRYFTIVMVAHRLSTVRKCDRILVFEKGHLVGADTYDRLVCNSLEFSQLTANHS